MRGSAIASTEREINAALRPYGYYAAEVNGRLIEPEEDCMRVGAAIRLNRDLYFRYTYGAFSRLGGALLRYRLNKRISLQAQTGDTHSIEVRYGVD